MSQYEIKPSPNVTAVERHRDTRTFMIVGGLVAVVAIIAAAVFFTGQNQTASQAVTDQSTAAAQQSAVTAQQAGAQAANADSQAQNAGAVAQANAAAAQANNSANMAAGAANRAQTDTATTTPPAAPSAPSN